MPGRKIEGGKKKSTKCLGPDNIKSEKVLRNSYEGNDGTKKKKSESDKGIWNA